MNRQVSRIIIRLETGEDVTFENHQFTLFKVEDNGTLEISKDGFIQVIYAAGYWKQVNIYYY